MIDCRMLIACATSSSIILKRTCGFIGFVLPPSSLLVGGLRSDKVAADRLQYLQYGQFFHTFYINFVPDICSLLPPFKTSASTPCALKASIVSITFWEQKKPKVLTRFNHNLRASIACAPARPNRCILWWKPIAYEVPVGFMLMIRPRHTGR